MNLRHMLRRLPAWPFRDILLPVVVTRIGLVLVALIGFYLCQKPVLSKLDAWEISANGRKTRLQTNHITPDAYPLINMWARWDSHWYLSIAKSGYQFNPHGPSTAAFFPLYPRLMRLVRHFVPMRQDAGWMVAGIILSNIALVVALCYLVLLIRMDFEKEIADRAVWYVLIFPVTLFFSAVYTESLFLALVVPAFYYARKSRWLVASLLGFIAARCRSPGFLLIVPFAFEYLAQKNFRWREIRIEIGWLALIPLGLFLHVLDLRLRFGSWDIMRQAQGIFGHTFTWPTTTMWRAVHGNHPLCCWTSPESTSHSFLDTLR